MAHQKVRYDSGEYKAYEGVIDALKTEAFNLDLLEDDGDRKSPFQTNHILCFDTQSHQDASVRNMVRSAAGQVLANERSQQPEDPARTRRIRSLVQKTQALMFAIQQYRSAEHKPDDPEAQENYRQKEEAVRTVEDHCKQYGIPSCLAQLHIPGGLFEHLRNGQYTIGQPGRTELYYYLVRLFAHDSDSLAAVLTQLQYQNQSGLMLDLVDEAARVSGRTIDDIIKDEKMLGTYVSGLYDCGDKDRLIAIVSAMHPSQILRGEKVTEKYLRSLLDTGHIAEAMAFLNAVPGKTAERVWHAVLDATVQIGWWFHANGRDADGLAFLKRRKQMDRTMGGHGDFKNVIAALSQAAASANGSAKAPSETEPLQP